MRESKREKERKKSGSAAGTAQMWKYLVVLSFLEPFIALQETSSNMPGRVEEEQAAGYNHPEKPEDPEEAEAETGLSEVGGLLFIEEIKYTDRLHFR